jgi:lipid-binding SYLF domain-containing protein
MFNFRRHDTHDISPNRLGTLSLVFSAIAAAALLFASAADAKIRGMDPAIKQERVKVSQADIDALDAAAEALIEKMRASSPVVVNYAQRADGVLIFPSVKVSGGFLIGEANALGVLYERDAAGAYQKTTYFRGERHRLGLKKAASGRSVIVMFMTLGSLDAFKKGQIDQSVQTIDVATGAIISGDPNDEIAGFVVQASGKVEGLTVGDVIIEPVKILD